MLNPQAFYNSRSDGFAVLEVTPTARGGARQFVPLRRTDLTGTATGPLAALSLTQTFSLEASAATAIEALYRFPLPGDAAVTGVCVRFGGVEIRTVLKERESAAADYKEAKRTGRQAALLTRESPDVFTLAVAGIRAGQDVVVRTDYVQLARPDGAGWSLRVPLTTAPRYVRADEAASRHASGQPLAVLRDPGHRYALDLTFADAEQIASPTHVLTVTGGRVTLSEGEVIPDRDCVVTWCAAATEKQPALRVWTHADAAGAETYFLALCAPPRWANAKTVPREVVLLVDHSGSMKGAKWEASDWAVERFLAGLSERDSFALGLFHDRTKWLAERPHRATPEAVREAVAFLKANRDEGGTEIGVALEQALDRPRASETPARHVLILTDAQVSDAGRVLRLADAESAKPDRRRVSVLCIDAAPNAALASELAERGGGVARFLTSNPDEDDITTALDEVLADWSAPVLTGMTLEVNRTAVEAAGRSVALVAPGAVSAIDVGDLPAGRPVWVIGRAPRGGEPITFRLRTGAEVVAEQLAESGANLPALKALFGADRVRRLEYVMTANYSGEDLRAELARLGYETTAVESKLYAESAREASTRVVRELLVRESLAAGVPCSETALVAVRSEVGQPVTETRIVGNALPKGWSGPAPGGGGVVFLCKSYGARSASAALGAGGDHDDDDTATDFDPLERQRGIRIPPPAPGSAPRGQNVKLTPEMIDRLRAASTRGQRTELPPVRPAGAIRITVTVGQHVPASSAVLFDSASSDTGQFTFLSVTFADKTVAADALDPELTLLLFVGDLATPRARVKLADVLRQGGRRPLNLRRKIGDPIRLALEDPSGAWAEGVPAVEVVLG